MATQTPFKPKIYQLLEHTKPSAPIFQRVNKDQRLRIDKRPNDAAYLKQTFTTQDGKNRTARLKLNCDTIWQDEQIKPEVGIGANEPFTTQERKAVEFINEICIARVPIVAEYLESIPQFEGWKKKNPNGFSEETALYKLLDKDSEAKASNEDIKKRIKAASKVADLTELKEAQDLIIRLNGTHFTPPEDLVAVQNLLFDFVDDADDAMLDAVLKSEKDITQDEKVNVLITRAVNEKKLSFSEVPNQVARKVGNKWVNVKEISNEHSLEERTRYFAEFLTSDSGKLLLADIEKDVKEK